MLAAVDRKLLEWQIKGASQSQLYLVNKVVLLRFTRMELLLE